MHAYARNSPFADFFFEMRTPPAARSNDCGVHRKRNYAVVSVIAVTGRQLELSPVQ